MMDKLTTEEKKVIDELRMRTINDVTPRMLEDNFVFYRFAKARDFDLAKAESMLRKHIAWRKEMQVDTILTDYDPPEVLVKYVPTSFICFDKHGSIARLTDCGRTDARGLWSSVTKADILKYAVYVIENDKERLIKSGRNLGQSLYMGLYDFESFTFASAMNVKTLQNTSHLLKMFMDNYPEFIRLGIVFNAPLCFSWFYSVIRPMLPNTVLQKIKIFGKNGWKDIILQNVEADELPSYLGGIKTDPDGNPLCQTFVIRGTTIPQKYYKDYSCPKSFLTSDVDKLTIRATSKEDIRFEVNKSNSILVWEFLTKDRDIDFYVAFRRQSSDDSESEDLVPKRRIQASDELEKGCILCEEVGIYSIVFDNSYSWFHSKEVYYRAEIKDPGY